MTITENKLMTWSEFETLANPDNAEHYELHDGEVVLVPPPSPRHFAIQRRLCELLRVHLNRDQYVVDKEFPYRPVAELQYWVADVGVVTLDHWRNISQAETWLPQPPTVIIEILSPSNLRSKIERQRLLALSSGCEQFWVVDPKTERVTVTSSDGVTRVFAATDVLPFDIEVSAIFEESDEL